MVFGLWEGSIALSLNKTNFAFGETIEGSLSLKLSKEKKARRLVVSIICERQTTTFDTRGSHTSTQVVFSSDKVLDGEKTYSPPGSEYKFSIQVPQGNAVPPVLEGKLGTALKAVQALAGGSSTNKWFLKAKLDIPMGIDVSRKVQISVQ